ncbi:MAG: hypothetical protein RMK65_00050 [Anaerolineae bacterium]|nr:hypothetical protein [Anaerolineae bacterium]
MEGYVGNFAVTVETPSAPGRRRWGPSSSLRAGFGCLERLPGEDRGVGFPMWRTA